MILAFFKLAGTVSRFQSDRELGNIWKNILNSYNEKPKSMLEQGNWTKAEWYNIPEEKFPKRFFCLNVLYTVHIRSDVGSSFQQKLSNYFKVSDKTLER